MNKTGVPNPNSRLLANAIIGGAGIAVPPDVGTPPNGMAAVVLYVPLESVLAKSPIELQADLGLPWSGPNGEPVWFDRI